MLRLRKKIDELTGSASGVAGIETAIIAPVLAIMVMGTVDVANYGAARLRVQQGINRGLELAMIGGPNTSTTTIRDEAAAQADVPSDQVTVAQSQTCAGTTATWGSSCTTGQETRRFIQITVTATFSPTFVGGFLIDLFDASTDITTAGVIRVQ